MTSTPPDDETITIVSRAILESGLSEEMATNVLRKLKDSGIEFYQKNEIRPTHMVALSVSVSSEKEWHDIHSLFVRYATELGSSYPAVMVSSVDLDCANHEKLDSEEPEDYFNARS
jgi:hypothetical protein